ncbi:DNA polymerase III subunit alpha [Mesomycoplasma ovipneumoniae]|uniref:DNA-directed DNA polymerase n=1 Tax=Mesomycoplasma ovipneumoniae 14811 TaxID=1188239 RepID=A0A014KVA0_9BACT|nr:DNA polymerase III subunit alpha [Mesomycoplasma ovipneumoniae]EXU60906.1 DNA polymerase III, alpha subunit [Mesomycoplasma ovipneumoniae 14811]
MNLINLHTRSEYTFLSSTIKLDSLIDFALKNNLKTLVLTDFNTMFGVPKFYKLCKENGINPVIGLEIEIEKFHFILLAKNYQGYVFLSTISTKKTKNEDIFLGDLQNQDNIIIIDHPRKGFYWQKKVQLSTFLGQNNLKNYYIVENNPKISNAIYVQERNVLHASEKIYLEALYKIKGETFDASQKLYDFDDWEVEIEPEIIKRTNTLVENIKIEFPKFGINLPNLDQTGQGDPDIILKNVLIEAINKKRTELENYNYSSRLKYEYKIISELKFSNYFLIIWDLLKWARENNILIGPGRGSASGSLIAYLLDITAVNPLKYNLIFERFLNPKRISMPDIDIDIQDTRRNEVIDYLFQKYGPEHCATIITFSTLAAKSIFRDISKGFGIPEVQINKNAKLISANTTLAQLYQNTKSEFYKLIQKGDNFQGQDNSAIYKKIYEISVFLEGMPRQSSTHAAGIVLSKTPISQLVPLHYSKENLNQIQYSAEFIEDFSLLKIDLLGLKNLTIVANILAEINKKGHNLQFSELPIYDKSANKLLSEGKTSGIFQLESPGMTTSIKKIGVNSINDVVAVISLYRPGPIKQIPTYATNKESKNWPKYFPEYDKILEPTFGVIIYQEQIMEICQVVAGFDLAQADIIRVAISKKDESKLEQIKKHFLEGGAKLGRDPKLVAEIYDKIYEFADYGFNKAHAVAYANLAYKMAYLKAKFPLYFFAELISNENGAQANIKKYVAEAKNFGIQILQPNINFSSHKATYFEQNKSIYLPLLMIKGLGTIAIKSIIDERQKNGKYKSFLDFIRRMKIINFSKVAIEKLIYANSLKEFANQETLAHNLDLLWNHATLVLTDKDGNLVALENNSETESNLLEKLPYNEDENYENEIKYLGMSFIEKKKAQTVTNQTPLKDLRPNNEYLLYLELKKVNEYVAKNGSTFYYLSLTDGETSIGVYSKNPDYSSFELGKSYKFKLSRSDKGKYSIKK